MRIWKLKLLARVVLFIVMSNFSGNAMAAAYPELTRQIYELASYKKDPEYQCQNGAYAVIADDLKQLVYEDHEVDLHVFCIPKNVLLNNEEHSEGLFIVIPKHDLGSQTDKQVISRLIANKILLEGHEPEYCEFEFCSKMQDRDASNDITAVKFAKKSYLADEMKLHSRIKLYIDQRTDHKGFIEYIQWVLKTQGFYVGKIDGIWGRGSERALTQFLLERSGYGSEEELQNLDADFFKQTLFKDILEFNSSENSMALTNSQEESGNHTNKKELSVSSNDQLESELAKDEQSEENTSDSASYDKNDFRESPDTLPADPNTAELKDYVLGLEEKLSIRKEQLDLLGVENKKLRDLLDKQSNKIASLSDEVRNADEQKQVVLNKSLKQLFLDYELYLPKIEGLDPNNATVLINIENAQLTDDILCGFNTTTSIIEQLNESFINPRCFQIGLEEYEEDVSRKRDYDADKNTLLLPVLQKQSSYIASITSSNLEGFNEQDTYSCHIGLKLVSNGYEKEDAKLVHKSIMLYLEASGTSVFLSDLNQIEADSITWKNRSFILVDETPAGVNKNSCLITSDNLIPIFAQDADPDNLAPVAIIDRDGNINLKNLPVVKKKAPELHVFLDTLAGPEGDQNYGFNSAIRNQNDRLTQRVYFEGFLKGLKSFLANKNDIAKLTIYQTVLLDNKRELDLVETFTKSDVPGEDMLLSDEFIAQYMTEFKAGVPGEFDNKKRKLSRLLSSNGNSQFISFGSSGLKADDICQSKQPRRDYNDNSLIFDVVPSYTIDQLAENDEVATVSRGFAFKCSNSNIIPLKPLETKDVEEVAEIVEMQLEGLR